MTHGVQWSEFWKIHKTNNNKMKAHTNFPPSDPLLEWNIKIFVIFSFWTEICWKHRLIKFWKKCKFQHIYFVTYKMITIVKVAFKYYIGIPTQTHTTAPRVNHEARVVLVRKIQTIWCQTWPDSRMWYEKTIKEFQILIETYQN